MKINREKALAAFQEYTDRYDSSRDMIRLKIEHTYRVCGLRPTSWSSPVSHAMSTSSSGRSRDLAIC